MALCSTPLARAYPLPVRSLPLDMSCPSPHLVVVGQGAAGLAAALTAAQEARGRAQPDADHADRQGRSVAGGRQHALVAVEHADGGARSGRVGLRARHAGGDGVSRRRGLFPAPRRRRAGDGRVDRGAGHRVQPAALLPCEGSATHPAGRRRGGAGRRLDARCQGRRRRDPLRLYGGRAARPRRLRCRRDRMRGRHPREHCCRCGRSRLWQLPGRQGHDARAPRAPRADHAPHLARHAFQHRRRHPHGPACRRGSRRRLERHARRAG